MTLENATLANISFSDTKITLKRGTAAEWTAANPVLAVGEPAFETDTGIMKIGDGVTAYNSLDYVGTESFSGSEIDTLLNTVNSSNISATHKITRSATIVVAASDSSAKSKAQADYVCDGTNDEVEIQAAITALPALGGKVYFCEGNYLKGTAAGITIPSNVELELNNAAIIKLANGINADACIFTNSDQTNGNSNITIIGGTLDGNEANQTAGIQCGVIFRKVSDLKIDMKIKSFRTLDMQIARSCSRVERNNRLRRQGNEIDIVTIDDMSTPENWVASAGMTITQDLTHKAIGTASLDVYNTSQNVGRSIEFTPATPLDLSNKVLRFWVRIPDSSYAAGAYLNIRAYSNELYAVYHYDLISLADQADGFVYIDLPVGNWPTQNFGDSGWSNITKISFVHYNCPPVHVWYGGLQMYSAPQHGVASITFDDGIIDVHSNALPIFNKYQCPANVAIVPSRCYTGLDGAFITWDHVRLMQSCGWDIHQHGYTHTNYSELTIPQIRADISKSTISMLQNGIYNSGEFVLPEGGFLKTYEFFSTLRKYCHMIRGTTGEINAIPTNPNYGRFIATDANLRSATIATAKSRTLKAMKFGGWIDLYMHTVGASGANVTPAQLDDFLAYLYDFGVPVKTWSEIANTRKNVNNYPAGYIAPGEIRTSTGALTAGAANAITLAWHNSEPCDILIKKVVVNIQTPGGTATSVLNFGIADDENGTNLGTEFFSGIDANSAAIRDSMISSDGGTQTKWVTCSGYGSNTDSWIVGKILTEAASALVGTYYIEYVGA